MKILVVGDSTGVSASHNLLPPGEFTGNSPWTASTIACQLLNEKYGEGSFTVVNKSYGGTTYGDWLYGKPSVGIPSFTELLKQNSDAEIVYIELGINNAWEDNNSVQNVKFAVNQMAALGKAAGMQVVFGTPNPVIVPSRPQMNILLSQIKEVIQTTVRGLGLTLVNHWDASVATGVWTKLLADGVHPKEEYYRFKGQTMFMGFCFMDYVVSKMKR